MNEAYADPENVVETLRHLHDVMADSSKVAVKVVHAGRARVVADTLDDLYDRNLYESFEAVVDDTICSIEMFVAGDGFTTLDLKFHEKSVENELCFTPAGPQAIFGQEQATRPALLGEDLMVALEQIDDELDPAYSFKGVEAASMANGGHFTDFEYEYAIDGVSL